MSGGGKPIGGGGTDDLIHALARDVTRRPARDIAAARHDRLLMLAALLAVVACAWVIGLREDAGVSLAWIAAKMSVALAIAVAGIAACRAAGSPLSTGATRAIAAMLALGFVLLAVVGLAGTPPSGWSAALTQGSPTACLTRIALLASPAFVAGLLIVARRAPLSPAQAGAAVGVAACGVGIGVYALSCPIDSVAFMAAWYAVAVAMLAALGAAVGSALLRW